ncbi:hypothetical protein [Bacillus infantis]|uniref:Uncharacterized protein n=1 Tax=Bacillus infantis TaxID=324767 RepID=A0A5D4RBK8_9BACI|nr:hypothetical protein [Bacillus infantis]TYS46952.1 hypothetical protein FZD51_15940 [Bacillus infantis]
MVEMVTGMVTGTCTIFLREDFDLGRFVLNWVPVTYTTAYTLPALVFRGFLGFDLGCAVYYN